MNRAGRKRKYSDRHRYIMSVLWLRGHSYDQIAGVAERFGVMGMNRARVYGVIAQTPFNGRDKMPAEMRQRFLDKLKAERLDGGILPAEMFEVMP